MAQDQKHCPTDGKHRGLETSRAMREGFTSALDVVKIVARSEEPRPSMIVYDPKPLPEPASEADQHIKAALLSNRIASAAPLGEGLPESFFDYGEIPTAAAADLHKIVSRVRRLHNSHVAAIVEIGNELAKAKALLGHGNFTPWLQAEFRWSDRTARNFMGVAEHFAGKSEILSVLDATTAYRLASPSTPPEVRTRVVERLEAGEPVRPDEVRDQIAEAKRAEAEAQKRARLTPEQRRKLEKKKAHEERDRQAWRSKWQAEARAREDAAHAAAEMVRPLLGDRLEEFAELMEQQKGGTDRFLDLLRGWKTIHGGSGPNRVALSADEASKRYHESAWPS